MASWIPCLKHNSLKKCLLMMGIIMFIQVYFNTV